MSGRRSLFHSWLLCFGLVSAGVASLKAQVVNRPPAPAWLEPEFADAPTQFFRREFEAPENLLKAVLHLAGEGRFEARLNETPLLPQTGGRAGEFDATPALTNRVNVLQVAITATNAAPRLALRLELNADVDGRRWIVSDADWQTSRDGVQWRRVAKARPAGPDERPFPEDTAYDAYNGWRLASGAEGATPPETLQTLPGFNVELIRSAQPGEGSWIAMAFDDESRLVLAREKRGLIRLNFERGFKFKSVEVVDDTLEEVRGLNYAFYGLYAHANRGRKLVRLTDRDRDGKYERIRTILETEGGYGHGRNKMVVGTDGYLYAAFGNSVRVPAEAAANSPLRRYGEDQLLPCPWDRSMFNGQSDAPGGFVLRIDPRGREVELFAGGFRNPVGLASNSAGELFTFDADMEWDVGAPWYMPNRVLHVVSGADYGWRRGTGRFPVDYPDTLPSVVDIGLASPTAVVSGFLYRYPLRYQRALYACDWAYGRIFAVHLEVKNGSYVGTPEVFLSGRPLNVTDITIGPDERLWFITGGRGTQSGLYRIRWHGEANKLDDGQGRGRALEDSWSRLKLLRKTFEQDHTRTRFSRAWEAERAGDPPLTEPAMRTNRFIRHSRRLVLENWLESAEAEKVQRLLRQPGPKSPDLLLALTRVRLEIPTAQIVTNLLRAPLPTALDEAMTAVRTLSLAFIRRGPPDEALRARCLAWIDAAFPHPLWQVNHELVELLVYLRSPGVIDRTLPLLKAAERPEDLLQYTFCLRLVREGWTPESRRAVFDALRRAARMRGAKHYYWAVRKVREEFIGALSPEERIELAGFFAEDDKPPLQIHGLRARFVREWTSADFADDLARPLRGRSHAAGRDALVAAQCTACHRVSDDPLLPAGLVGPDLASVGTRFGPRDLLDHILNPSNDIDDKYRAAKLRLRDDEEVIGSIEHEDDAAFYVRQHALAEATVRVEKSRVTRRGVSDVSIMPPGLLNSLGKEQVLDLLAYLHAGGDAAHKVFQDGSIPVAEGKAVFSPARSN